MSLQALSADVVKLVQPARAAKNTGGAVTQQGAAASSAAAAGGSAGTLAGDVTGPAAGNTVSTLQAVTLTLTAPATGDLLTYNGTGIVNSGTIGGSVTITGALTVSGGPSSLGATTLTGDLTLSTHNLVTDGSVGTKVGTSAVQKLGFWGHAPVVQPGTYTVTNATTNRSLDEAAATLAQVAQVLGTLLTDLQGMGIVG